jgi:hypothetical protein
MKLHDFTQFCSNFCLQTAYSSAPHAIPHNASALTLSVANTPRQLCAGNIF